MINLNDRIKCLSIQLRIYFSISTQSQTDQLRNRLSVFIYQSSIDLPVIRSSSTYFKKKYIQNAYQTLRKYETCMNSSYQISKLFTNHNSNYRIKFNYQANTININVMEVSAVTSTTSVLFRELCWNTRKRSCTL